MYLYSSKVMLKLILMNSGVCWYFANSSCQASALSGGTDPLIGFHSVIESPERVRRTNAPNTMRKATIELKMTSQFPTRAFGITLAPPARAGVVITALFFEVPVLFR